MNKFDNVNDALRWRYAAKFKNTMISNADLSEILEAGNLAATSYGLQPFKFVVVKDQAIKEALVAHSWNQEHVAKNSHYIVLAIDTNIDDAYVSEYADRLMNTRGLTTEQVLPYREMMLGSMKQKGVEGRNDWASRQAYIALGTMMARASEIGIDTHALEGFSPLDYDKTLGLKDNNLHAVVALAVGYRTDEDPIQHAPKVRKELSVMTITI